MAFGFWLHRSSETDLKLGRTRGCLRRPRTLGLPRLCRWSLALKLLMWKDHTDVLLRSTRSPGAWIVIGRQAR
eukprot:2753290-Amphidinium_carterae.1